MVYQAWQLQCNNMYVRRHRSHPVIGQKIILVCFYRGKGCTCGTPCTFLDEHVNGCDHRISLSAFRCSR